MARILREFEHIVKDSPQLVFGNASWVGAERDEPRLRELQQHCVSKGGEERDFTEELREHTINDVLEVHGVLSQCRAGEECLPPEMVDMVLDLAAFVPKRSWLTLPRSRHRSNQNEVMLVAGPFFSSTRERQAARVVRIDVYVIAHDQGWVRLTTPRQLSCYA